MATDNAVTLETLTHTKRRDFQNCQRYYMHRHLQHLSLRAQKGGRRRGSIFGNAIYDALVTRKVAPDTDLTAVVNQSVEKAYDELIESGNIADDLHRTLEVEAIKVAVMAAGYIARYPGDVRREIEFNLPLVNPKTGASSRAFRVGGKIDGVVMTGDSHTVEIVEDKLVQSIQPAMIQRLPLDSQTSEYVSAFRAKGWDANVSYRHTRLPGKNPLPPREYKTKEDFPGETLDEFRTRLEEDLAENPDSYFNEQRLYFPKDHLDDYLAGRWGIAQQILTSRRAYRKLEGTKSDEFMMNASLASAFPKNDSRCWEYGGCEFIPLCTKMIGAMDLYEVVPENQELRQPGDDDETVTSVYGPSDTGGTDATGR